MHPEQDEAASGALFYRRSAVGAPMSAAVVMEAKCFLLFPPATDVLLQSHVHSWGAIQNLASERSRDVCDWTAWTQI